MLKPLRASTSTPQFQMRTFAHDSRLLARPLTAEQVARIETNKKKALAIRVAKEEARVAAKV